MILLLAFTARAVVDRTFYDLLGLNITANEGQVKDAYKIQSRKMHPDRVRTDDREAAQQLFQAINVAYETLIDPQSRSLYDWMGPDFNNENKKQVWGSHPPKDGSFYLRHEVTLKEKFSQVRKVYSITKSGACPKCNGTGAHTHKDFTKCSQCNGRGITEQRQQYPNGFYNMVPSKCNRCQGSGSVVTRACPFCKGSKIVPAVQKFYAIELKKSMKAVQNVVVKNLGDERSNNVPADCVVTLVETPSQGFSRSGEKDLLTELQISLEEALTGFSKQIEHLNGKKIEVAKQGVSQPDQIVAIEREGMGEKGEEGNLLVRLKVRLPTLDQARAERLLNLLGV